MAKQKSRNLSAGARVKVKAGTQMPEFPDQSIGGWTGIVAEQRGRGSDLQYIIEWDDATVAALPQSYRDQCEEQGLFFRMACLPADQVEAADADS